jgi:S-formylglutathione hydrolase
MQYRVFLPEKVPTGQTLPVVYLLHGNGGGFRDWSNDSDVSKYALKGLILVMPEGESSYYLNSGGRPGDKFEDYLKKDLVSDVESRFPARRDRAGRAIVGVSMGGFAAVKLALSRPELYGFAGAISPAIDVAERRFSWKRLGQWWHFRQILGPWGSEDRKARDPFELVKTADPKATPYVYLGVGRNEPLRAPVERFAGKLKARGFAYEFHQKPGGHDWGQWDAQLPGCFESLMGRLG